MLDAMGPPWIQKASGSGPFAPFGLTRKVCTGVPSVEGTSKLSSSAHLPAGLKPESRASGFGVALRSGAIVQHSGAAVRHELIPATRPPQQPPAWEFGPPDTGR